jgi:alpha-amylase/alpha-mannosidase (GH57 family)
VKPIALCFLWHLHQPLYRPRGERVAHLPWARLHALRSYYDMVRVLEEFPEIRVTMNLTPVLIEQVRAYETGGSDVFWEAAAEPAEDLDETRRAFLFENFFSAQTERMIGGLPRLRNLLDRREHACRVRGPEEAWRELSTEDYRDLQVLFDLSWFGFKAREDFPEIEALRRQGRSFTQEDLRTMHAVERTILGRVVPLYRDAAARGRIEISVSPYAHPILPLLCDTDAAREALPHAGLPARFRHPEDARAQIEEALALAEREFGVRPRGLWPSEGAVSVEAAAAMDACGIAWAASDEEVLKRSEHGGHATIRHPWRLGSGGPDLLFRDHDLSDRIGFRYARLEASEASADFIAAIRARAAAEGGDAGLLLVALDGENPWEHYAQAGGDFLRALYGALSKTEEIACRTVSEAVGLAPERGVLGHLHAGSWIDTDFSVWIAGPEKNRAWEMLGRARDALAAARSDPSIPDEARRAAWISMRAAEGSDWFWWLDDRFPSLYRPRFESLLRLHLAQVYEALGQASPDDLDWPIRSPEPRSAEGPVRIETWISPRIDGYENDYFEWQGATRVGGAALSDRSAMRRSSPLLASLRFGFSAAGEFLLRLDPGQRGPGATFPGLGLDLVFRSADAIHVLALDLDVRGEVQRARVRRPETGDPRPGTGDQERSPARLLAAARKILELSVPVREVGLLPGRRAGLQIRLRRGDETLSLREIDLEVPTSSADERAWNVR